MPVIGRRLLGSHKEDPPGGIRRPPRRLSTIRHAIVLGYDGFEFFLTLYRLAGMERKIADENTTNEALDLV